MTVKEFLQNYGGNECVSIEGYCEEEHYDYGQGNQGMEHHRRWNV